MLDPLHTSSPDNGQKPSMQIHICYYHKLSPKAANTFISFSSQY